MHAVNWVIKGLFLMGGGWKYDFVLLSAIEIVQLVFSLDDFIYHVSLTFISRFGSNRMIVRELVMISSHIIIQIGRQ